MKAERLIINSPTLVKEEGFIPTTSILNSLKITIDIAKKNIETFKKCKPGNKFIVNKNTYEITIDGYTGYFQAGYRRIWGLTKTDLIEPLTETVEIIRNDASFDAINIHAALVNLLRTIKVTYPEFDVLHKQICELTNSITIAPDNHIEYSDGIEEENILTAIIIDDGNHLEEVTTLVGKPQDLMNSKNNDILEFQRKIDENGKDPGIRPPHQGPPPPFFENFCDKLKYMLFGPCFRMP